MGPHPPDGLPGESHLQAPHLQRFPTPAHSVTTARAFCQKLRASLLVNSFRGSPIASIEKSENPRPSPKSLPSSFNSVYAPSTHWPFIYSMVLGAQHRPETLNLNLPALPVVVLSTEAISWKPPLALGLWGAAFSRRTTHAVGEIHFCVWLPSLRVMSSEFIHIVLIAFIRTSFHFMAKYYFIVWL